MRLNVDIARDLDLLDGLRSRLAVLGAHAEMREHLMSLVVFAAPPAMPVCVFVGHCGRCFSWHGGQERHPVTDLAGAAIRLAASANGDPSCEACRPAAERARTSWGLVRLTDTRTSREAPMAEQANTPLRVMTSESSWRCHRSYAGQASQVRHARAFLAQVLEGCPMADDVILCASELAANAAVHSHSAMPGGAFTVRAEVKPGDYAWIEVEDDGGPWLDPGSDGDPRHGLDIVRALASDWGIEGDYRARTIWVRLDWSAS
jgi:hypothetical protein